MKQKDWLLIIAIAVVSGIFSFIISGRIFVTPANRQQAVEVVDAITPEFKTPDNKYFNTQSVNPAQTIQLGTGGNANPFNGGSH